jgi:cytosine/uracil/thiamine/allantoin permease
MAGDALSNGMPLWMKFISLIGVPSSIALYLIWFLTITVLGAISDHNDDHAEEMRVLTSVMQQICANTAENSTSRARCFPALPR